MQDAVRCNKLEIMPGAFEEVAEWMYRFGNMLQQRAAELARRSGPPFSINSDTVRQAVSTTLRELAEQSPTGQNQGTDNAERTQAA